MIKVCSVCKIEKPYTEYAKLSASPIGIRSQCKECDKAYQKKVAERRKQWSAKYYEDNKEKVQQVTERCRKERIKKDINRAREMYSKAYYRNIEYHKQRYLENKTQINEKQKEWRATPSGKASKINSEAQRRAKRKSTYSENSFAVVSLLKKHTPSCYYCGSKIDKLHIDHYIPLSMGGGHIDSNLVASCSDCNLRKGKQMPITFIQGENYGWL